MVLPRPVVIYSPFVVDLITHTPVHPHCALLPTLPARTHLPPPPPFCRVLPFTHYPVSCSYVSSTLPVFHLLSVIQPPGCSDLPPYLPVPYHFDLVRYLLQILAALPWNDYYLYLPRWLVSLPFTFAVVGLILLLLCLVF